MMPHEIKLGDDHQFIVLKFERDGLWVAGEYNGSEIPHKMVGWSHFEAMRHQAERKHNPSLYETLEREGGWSSAWPDMRSFMAAVHHYLPRDSFKLEGRMMATEPFNDQEEHTILTFGRRMIWDFGPLNHSEDVAWRVAFRRFEENLDVIHDRIDTLKHRTIWPWYKRFFYRVKKRRNVDFIDTPPLDKQNK
jgi:hypothetical protein